MKKNRLISTLLTVLLLTTAIIPFSTFAAEPPEVTAQHALLMDAHYDEVLYDKGAYEKTSPASITKVMTALLVMEAIEAGALAPEDMITADESSQKGLTSDSSTQNIKPGETMSVKDLLYCMMVPSANEAANILAVAVDGSVDTFLQHMNSRAQELGCLNTHFANTHGMPEENHYSTAYDIYLYTKAAMEYDLFREIVYTSVYETQATNLAGPRTFYNTNGLITQWRFRGYLYDKALGVKTGSTGESNGYCLVSAAEDGDEYLIAVVLGAEQVLDANGNITDRRQFSESRALYQWGFSNFQRTTISKDSSPVAQVAVTLSQEADSVMVKPVGEISRTLPVDLNLDEIESTITMFQDTVEAPVQEGQVLGTMTLSCEDEVFGTLDLVAVNSVERSEFLYRQAQVKAFFEQSGTKLVLGAVLILVLIVLLRLFVFRKRRRPSAAGRRSGGGYSGRRRR